jgi:uncharacterized phage infection (PIP) family protein YhgE
MSDYNSFYLSSMKHQTAEKEWNAPDKPELLAKSDEHFAQLYQYGGITEETFREMDKAGVITEAQRSLVMEATPNWLGGVKNAFQGMKQNYTQGRDQQAKVNFMQQLNKAFQSFAQVASQVPKVLGNDPELAKFVQYLGQWKQNFDTHAQAAINKPAQQAQAAPQQNIQRPIHQPRPTSPRPPVNQVGQQAPQPQGASPSQFSGPKQGSVQPASNGKHRPFNQKTTIRRRP